MGGLNPLVTNTGSEQLDALFNAIKVFEFALPNHFNPSVLAC